MRIAVLGLGRMGTPMARNLIELGHEVTLYSRDGERAKKLAGKGARACGTVAEAVAKVQVALTMVTDDAAEEALTFGAGGLLESLGHGAIHLCMSTIGVDLSRWLSETHAAAGQGFVAAPVLGKPSDAASRRLWILAGGPENEVNRCLVILEALGRGITRVGLRPELAHALKLGANLLTVAMVETLGEVLAFGEKAGFPPADYMRILNLGLLKSPPMDAFGGLMVRQDHEPSDQTLDLAAKDLGLLVRASSELGAALPMAEILQRQVGSATARGLGGRDLTALALAHRQDGATAAPPTPARPPAQAEAPPTPARPPAQAEAPPTPARPRAQAEAPAPPVKPLTRAERRRSASQRKPGETERRKGASQESRRHAEPRPAPAAHGVPAPPHLIVPRPQPFVAPRPSPISLPRARPLVLSIPVPPLVPDPPHPVSPERTHPAAPEHRQPLADLPPVVEGPRAVPGAMAQAPVVPEPPRSRVPEPAAPVVAEIAPEPAPPVAARAPEPPAAASLEPGPPRLVGSRYPAQGNGGRVMLDLNQTTHFELIDGTLHAWVEGRSHATAWRSFEEVERALGDMPLVRVQRSILLNPQAVTDLRFLFGGRAKVRVTGGVELSATREAAKRLKFLLGV